MSETPTSSRSPRSRRPERQDAARATNKPSVPDPRLVGAAVVGALLDAMTFGALREE
jgi:hypothetical protein